MKKMILLLIFVFLLSMPVYAQQNIEITYG